MGTIIFPEAALKVFLQASPEVRAERRANQLKEKRHERYHARPFRTNSAKG